MADPADDNNNARPEPTMAASSEVGEMQELVSRYGSSVGVGFALAVIAIFGWITFNNYQQGQKDQANFALAVAENAEDFQGIAADFASTPSAPLASLALAKRLFQDGDYDGAFAAYANFEATYPDHPMIDAVQICKSQCREAAGKLDEALAGFTEFVEAKPVEHYLRPQAHLGRARCLEQLGRWAEAKAVYEEFLATYPETAWIDQAEIAMRTVDKVLRTQATN